MQAIGYKELAAALLAGRPIQDGVDEVKLRSRQYAKRQLTWLRRDPQIRWFGPSETAEMIAYIDGSH